MKRNQIFGSPHKDVLGEDSAKITGAEIDCSAFARGRDVVSVGSPCKKRLALAFVSMQMSTLPITTDALMACVIGGWTSAIMYRRPFMSILDVVHKEFDFGNVSQDSLLLR